MRKDEDECDVQPKVIGLGEQLIYGLLLSPLMLWLSWLFFRQLAEYGWQRLGS